MTLRVAVAQLESAVGTEAEDPRPANMARLAEAFAQAQATGANLLVVGEMFITGLRTDQWLSRYAVNVADPDDTVTVRLNRLCREHGVAVLVGSATRGTEPGVVHNSVLYLDPQGTVQVVHKRHLARIRLPDGQEADETRFYSPGSTPTMVRTPWGRLAVQICYEVTFPEVARSSMLDGANLIVNCTASISGAEDLWNAMSVTRAFENSAWFVVSSVVGRQGDECYYGGSTIVSPDGVIVARGAFGAEDFFVHDIDLERAEATRTRMNVLRARRPELYTNLVHERAGR